ncbi:MAG: OmpA family protein, partial [Planctomycetota bacterium]
PVTTGIAMLASKFSAVAALAVIAAVFTGCAAQSNVDELQTINRQLETQILELKAELDEKNAMIAALQASPRRSSELQNRLAAAQAERDRLAAALADAEAALRNITPVTLTRLPQALDSQLRRLAQQNPGLMEYDADRGMIRLRSDLTFALGSTELSDSAQASLSQLAGVLQSSAASPYGVRIAGHTDNVPVRNAANVQRFGDNWGLSAFRAISVMKALHSAGISPQRTHIAGYGEFSPIVANGTQGARENRRVDIFLVETAPAAALPPASSSSSSAPAADPAPVSTTEADPAVFK